MSKPYSFQRIPQTRIATFDVYSIGMSKHHISALLEFDVTDARQKLRDLRRQGKNVSFNAWIIKAVSKAVEKHPEVAAFLYSKKKLILFKDINISFMVEKDLNDTRVPIPLVLQKTNEKSLEEITIEIEEAKAQVLKEGDIVLKKSSSRIERFYYNLPAFLRRSVWRNILSHPKFAYRKMGNVVITSLGMTGKLHGWFIHKSIHPLSFGMGSVLKKPWIIDDKVEIRDILNMTVLIDHDAVDGAPMVRFLKDLTGFIEKGGFLNNK